MRLSLIINALEQFDSVSSYHQTNVYGASLIAGLEYGME